MKQILLIIFLMPAISAQGFISTIYGKIFGNVDAKQEYRDLAQQALKDMGIKYFKDVPVKQMNNVGPVLALMPLSSFTACGIWLDEKYLEKCSLSKRTFVIYHEAAHYVQHHHQKLLAIGTATTAGMIVLLTYVHKKLAKKGVSYTPAITTGAGVLLSTAFYLGLSPKMMQEQEKEADIIAAKTLIRLGKKELVKQYIQELKQDQPMLWWYSEQLQSEYLSAAIQF